VLGLLVSWYAGTAAGATIAAVAVTLFFVSALASHLRGLRAVGTPVSSR
jgi:ABC-type Mn2+/Zn2+ transport system permease subunit